MLKFFCFLSIFLSSIYAIEISDLSLNGIARSTEETSRCDEFPGRLFVPSLRGCKFYFFCTEEQRGEGWCPIVKGVQLHFHAESESCQLPENSECSIDAEMTGLTCPEFGSSKIPHPYMCSKYTGRRVKLACKSFKIFLF